MTYPNECLLRERKCNEKPKLKVRNEGICHDIVHNHEYDDYILENRPDLVEVDYESDLFKVQNAPIERFGINENEPIIPDIRETMYHNAFYYQPDIESPQESSNFLLDAVAGKFLNLKFSAEFVKFRQRTFKKKLNRIEYSGRILEKSPLSRKH